MSGRTPHPGGPLPREKSLREFDCSVNPNVEPAVVRNLATCEWIAKGHALCPIGDSGTGKSHLLIALGTAAAMAGYRVRYTAAAAVVRALIRLNGTQRRYAAPADMMAHGLVMRTSRHLATCTDALHALRCPKGLVFRQAAKPNPQE